MSKLRRAVSRKEFAGALVIVLVGGGWLGWHWLTQRAGGVVGEVVQAVPREVEAARLQLEAGQYAAAMDTLQAAQRSGEPVCISRYKALARLAGGETALALQEADAALGQGVSGSDAAMAAGVKALALLHDEHLQVGAARQAVDLALQQAGEDAEAQLLARTAQAAVLRSELDSAGSPEAVLQQVAQVRQILSPLVEGTPEPQAGWRKQLWRRGLATLVDAGIVASRAGDPSSEQQALALMRQSCPQDVWGCHFTIPGKALAAARAGTLDDHARIAMYTATGVLYSEAGDRIHCDALFQKGIDLYARLMEEYDGWTGEQVLTQTPNGQIKKVGIEFYDYRDRQKRLARYSADWWGIRVVEGVVDLPTALAVCEVPLFRAMVRIRAEGRRDPIAILYEERVPHFDYRTAGEWFKVNPHTPQADWERQRAEVILRVEKEESAAIEAVASARRLVRQDRSDEALAELSRGLEVEPSLAETGITLRCEMADALMRAGRHAEALPILAAAREVMARGDVHLGRGADQLKGRVWSYEALCLAATGKAGAAIDLGEQIVADETIQVSVRLSMLRHLARFHVLNHDSSQARAAYIRLAAFPTDDPNAQQMRDAFLAGAETFLRKEGVLASESRPVAVVGVSSQPVRSCCGQ